jgi:hypothetical protein
VLQALINNRSYRLDIKVDDLCSQANGFNVQPCKGDGKLKSTRARTPRVQEQHAASPLDERFVRMTSDDRRDFRGFRIEIQLIGIMQHVDVVTAEFHELRGRQVLARAAFVDISQNRGDRR